MNEIFLIGSGGHAKVVLDAMIAANCKPHGIIDNDPDKLESLLLGVTVIGDDNIFFNRFSPNDAKVVVGIGSVRSTKIRNQVYQLYNQRGYKFLNVIHPYAKISQYCQLQNSIQILANVTVNAGSVIGNNSILNTGSTIDHDCVIGNSVHIAPGVTLSGNVRIGDDTHIGTGAIVIQNISIGKNCLIGAGSVVLNNVPDNSVVVGCPARVIKKNEI
ncbi:MAG: acetyltransferase [Leptospira sp.]|nr:acetyltransferase [Leptospira sp.]